MCDCGRRWFLGYFAALYTEFVVIRVLDSVLIGLLFGTEDFAVKMSAEDSKFGFKDKEKAVETLKLLESEEMQYQKLTVRGLVGRAKRVLTSGFFY